LFVFIDARDTLSEDIGSLHYQVWSKPSTTVYFLDWLLFTTDKHNKAERATDNGSGGSLGLV